MKRIIALTIIVTAVLSCNEKSGVKHASVPLEGTWQLLSGTVIQKGDTVVTNYDKNISVIKIINDSHFSFLQHDKTQGEDENPAFAAGGGRYTLQDSFYTEHLEYCSARKWEGNDFKFVVKIKGDTLIQSGVEKIEGEGIDQMNIEKYVRLKQ